MLPVLLRQLSGEWLDPLRRADVVLKPPLSALEVTANRDQAAKATFLIFSAGQSQPSVVLKWARSPDAQTRLAHEYQALSDISAIPALQSSVPGLLGRFGLGDGLAIVESCLPGTPLSVLLSRHERTQAEHIRHDLFRAHVWVQLLQTATALGAMQFPGRTAVEQRIERLAHAGPRREVLPRAFLDRLCREADDYQELRLPLAGQHGDFRPSNFMVDTSQVGVVDWENFTRGTLPLDDIFNFAIGLTQAYPRAKVNGSTAREAFHHAFVESNWFSNLIGEYVNRYLRAMHLPEQAAYLLFSLFLMDMATLESQRGLVYGSGRDAPWQQLLITYAQNEKHSIFGPRTSMLTLPKPSTSLAEGK